MRGKWDEGEGGAALFDGFRTLAPVFAARYGARVRHASAWRILARHSPFPRCGKKVSTSWKRGILEGVGEGLAEAAEEVGAGAVSEGADGFEAGGGGVFEEALEGDVDASAGGEFEEGVGDGIAAEGMG